MKRLQEITIAIMLLTVGFGAGFPVGKNIGFKMGSEWALVQAEILAREAGSFMPVYLSDGTFRIVLKQPKNLYRTAWRLAERHQDQTGNALPVIKPREPGLQSAWIENRRPAVLRVADQTIR